MPEEPDVSPEEMEVLDRVWRRRIQAKKQQRQEHINSIADRILQALQSRPDGMRWAEIRGLFDNNHSDEEVRQALLMLTTKPTIKIKRVEQTEDHSGERFLLAAG